MSQTCDLLNAMHRSSSLIKKWNAFYLTAKLSAADGTNPVSRSSDVFQNFWATNAFLQLPLKISDDSVKKIAAATEAFT